MTVPGIAPKVPILFLTGTNDTTVAPDGVWQQYERTAGVEKAFAEIAGADHVDSTDKGKRRENVFVYDWLACKFKSSQAACKRVTACAEPGVAVVGHGCHHEVPSTADAAPAAALQAYTYFYPLLLMDETRRQALAAGTGAVPNAFAHQLTFHNVSDHSIVRPNVDTLYSLVRVCRVRVFGGVGWMGRVWWYG